jgi:hypothetical protein
MDLPPSPRLWRTRPARRRQHVYEASLARFSDSPRITFKNVLRATFLLFGGAEWLGDGINQIYFMAFGAYISFMW